MSVAIRLALFAFILLFGVTAQAQVSSFKLKNGLNILVKEDHRAPVVVQQVWYRVGSNYEENGKTGISHMLEHMMFKGTKTLKPGEFSKIVAKLGGQENAFTSSDYTVYYQVIGKQHLAEVMKLEADRMRNLVIDDKEFQKERDVVTEERRWRVEDKPESRLYEQFNAMAFLNSPPHHPTIGWMNDIRHYTAKDLRRWYRKWYAPNNATLVVVGDVNPKQVLKLAKKYYGPNQPETILPPKPQVEIPQQGERRLVLKGATKSPTVMMGVHVPTLVTAKTAETRKEVYALTVLNSILDGDDSSRLTKDLVRGTKQLADAGAGYDGTDRLQTLFMLQGTPSAGVPPHQAEQALWQEITRLQKQPISAQEFKRVLAQAEAQYVYHQDSIQAQAMIMGSLVSVGLPADTVDHWIENLRKVTPKDVQTVAKKYFSKDKLTIGVLLPNGQKAKSSSGQLHAGGIR